MSPSIDAIVERLNAHATRIAHCELHVDHCESHVDGLGDKLDNLKSWIMGTLVAAVGGLVMVVIDLATRHAK